MPTFLQFASDSLAAVKAIGANMTPSGAQLDFTRRTFNDMVQNWSTNRLRLSFVPEAVYQLAPTVGAYQIGPGAAVPGFDTNTGPYIKPVFIQSGRVLIGTARRWPLNILARPEWDVCQTRSLSDPDGPLDLFYDYNSPVATFNFAPKPGAIQTLYLSQWNALKTFALGEEQLNLEDFYPQEYLSPLKRGLAIEIAPAVGFQINPDLVELFQADIQRVERMNNDKLSGAYGFSRTLDAPVKGDGSQGGGQAPPGQ